MEPMTKRAWAAAAMLALCLGARAQTPGFRLGDGSTGAALAW